MSQPVGLDPIQIQQVRQLITELGRTKKHTILLSTHILSEVHATCDRVIMIARGSIVADAKLKDLEETHQAPSRSDLHKVGDGLVMSHILTIARKELTIYFSTVVGYAGFGTFAFLMGLLFITALNRFQIYTQQLLSSQKAEMLARLNFNEAIVHPNDGDGALDVALLRSVPDDATLCRRETEPYV